MKKTFIYSIMLFCALQAVYSQNTADTVNEALGKASEYLRGRVSPDAKIAVLNFQADFADVSDYVIMELIANLVNLDFIVVDRHNLEVLQSELNFQMSGSVSDETAQTVGKMLGAQVIVSGAITTLGDMWRFNMRIFEVESARILGMYNCMVMQDSMLNALSGKRTRLSQSLKDNSGDFWTITLGASPFFSVHFYDTGSTTFEGVPAEPNGAVDLAVNFGYRLFKNFALQTGLLFTADTMNVSFKEKVYDADKFLLYTHDASYTYTSHSLLVPLLLEGLYENKSIKLSALAGAYGAFPLGQIEEAANYTEAVILGKGAVNFGFMAGANIALKAGRNAWFLEIRYAGDFSPVSFEADSKTKTLYKRNILFLGIGYEIGFLQKNSKNQKGVK